MLSALLDDRALTAAELAGLAEVSPETASAHLAQLVEGDLITLVRRGRNRYYRLNGPDVAAAIEALGHLTQPMAVPIPRASQHRAALAAARTCYDHLAGRAGVALLDALRARRIVTSKDQPLAVLDVTNEGEGALSAFGINVKVLRKLPRLLAGECLDWTERRYHLNGALGAAITGRLLDLGWIERGVRHRVVKITVKGERGLAATFGWSDWASTGSTVQGA